MNEWVKLTEYNWAFWVAGLFALFDFFKWAFTGGEWLVNKFGFETKNTRRKREWNERLTAVEKAIVEIKQTATDNVNMFLDHEKKVVEEFSKSTGTILGKLDELHNKMNAQNEASTKTDRAILRDRIVGGMRYFSQNKDEHGDVHISFSDHENMEALFQEYFAKGGNGTIKNMYENEFKHFIIDR